MYNRRKFFRNSGALALGGLMLSRNGYASWIERLCHAPRRFATLHPDGCD